MLLQLLWLLLLNHSIAKVELLCTVELQLKRGPCLQGVSGRQVQPVSQAAAAKGPAEISEEGSAQQPLQTLRASCRRSSPLGKPGCCCA